MDWDKYGYVTASNYRKKIVLVLGDKPKTPKEIEEESNFHLSHISNTLSDLSDEGIIKCLTEERKKGRVYSLTELGKEIVRQLER